MEGDTPNINRILDRSALWPGVPVPNEHGSVLLFKKGEITNTIWIVYEHELIYRGTKNPFGTWYVKES